MQTNVELNQEEAKEVIQQYLEEKKDMEVDIEDISFNIGRSSAQPGQVGSPKVKSITCENVNNLEE